MKPFVSISSPAQAKFLATRKELSAALVERDEEVDLVLCALVGQEHPLLVGPPGCAKSLLLDALARWLDGRKFTALLTKFAQMEDLFGPISLKSLKEDRYVRVTTGKLPSTASCCARRCGPSPPWRAGSACSGSATTRPS